MTLIGSAYELERLAELGRTRIRLLWTYIVDATLGGQIAYQRLDIRVGYGTHGDFTGLMLLLASPTYSPLVPYAGFGKVELEYSSIIREHEKGVERSFSGKGADSSQSLSFKRSDFRLYVLPMGWEILYAELGLDKYLGIDEHIYAFSIAQPRLLPTLLL